MTTRIIELPNAIFRKVCLTCCNRGLPELRLHVESQGASKQFTLIKPFFVMPKDARIDDAERHLKCRPWALVTVNRNENQGANSYCLECEDASGSRLAIHGTGYRDTAEG